VPLLLYLDQFIWIELARAAGPSPGRVSSAQRQGLLDSVRQRRVVSPLSSVHYLETWQRGNPRNRAEVAREMALASRFVTIAPLARLLAGQIDRGLQIVFGRPAQQRAEHVLGLGVQHAFGVEADDLAPLAELTAEDRFIAEWSILAAHEAGSSYDEYRQQRSDVQQRFARSQSALASRLTEWAVATDERRSRTRVSVLQEFEAELIAALIGADVSITELGGLDLEGWDTLTRSIPSVDVMAELRLVRFSNPSQLFKPSDLNDIRALAAAMPYCDVVVTDKAWAAAVGRTELSERLGVRVVSSLEDALEDLS
jgi:hypothetical protein